MSRLAEALAFCAIVAAAAALEISGKPSEGLWFIVVMWVLIRAGIFK